LDGKNPPVNNGEGIKIQNNCIGRNAALYYPPSGLVRILAIGTSLFFVWCAFLEKSRLLCGLASGRANPSDFKPIISFHRQIVNNLSKRADVAKNAFCPHPNAPEKRRISTALLFL